MKLSDMLSIGAAREYVEKIPQVAAAVEAIIPQPKGPFGAVEETSTQRIAREAGYVGELLKEKKPSPRVTAESLSEIASGLEIVSREIRSAVERKDISPAQAEPALTAIGQAQDHDRQYQITERADALLKIDKTNVRKMIAGMFPTITEAATPGLAGGAFFGHIQRQGADMPSLAMAAASAAAVAGGAVGSAKLYDKAHEALEVRAANKNLGVVPEPGLYPDRNRVLLRLEHKPDGTPTSPKSRGR